MNIAEDRPETVPVISLVVCTRNRCHRLEKTLFSLQRLTSREPWEIVIVNNASTDDTRGVLARFHWPPHLTVRVVDAERVGLAAARNAGWCAAKGRIIAFTDDDCYPREDYLDSVLSVFSAEPIAYMGGQILLHDQTDYPITIQTRDSPAFIEPMSFMVPGFIQGANMAIRRAALIAMEGFDENLGAGTPFPSEDVDILARLSASGYSGRYDPASVVFHHHGRKAGDDIRRLEKGYDRGRGAYYLKCLRIPAFRGIVLHELYGSLRWDVVQSFRQRSLQWKFLNEMYGLTGYAWVRFAIWLRKLPVRG